MKELIYKENTVELDPHRETTVISGKLSQLWPYDNCFHLIGMPIKDEEGEVVGVIADVTPGTDDPRWYGKIYLDSIIGSNIAGKKVISCEIQMRSEDCW